MRANIVDRVLGLVHAIVAVFSTRQQTRWRAVRARRYGLVWEHTNGNCRCGACSAQRNLSVVASYVGIATLLREEYAVIAIPLSLDCHLRVSVELLVFPSEITSSAIRMFS